MISSPVKRFLIQLTITFVIFVVNTLVAMQENKIQNINSPTEWCKSKFDNYSKPNKIKTKVVNICIDALKSNSDIITRNYDYDVFIRAIEAKYDAKDARKDAIGYRNYAIETFLKANKAKINAYKTEKKAGRAYRKAYKTEIKVLFGSIEANVTEIRIEKIYNKIEEFCNKNKKQFKSDEDKFNRFLFRNIKDEHRWSTYLLFNAKDGHGLSRFLFRSIEANDTEIKNEPNDTETTTLSIKKTTMIAYDNAMKAYDNAMKEYDNAMKKYDNAMKAYDNAKNIHKDANIKYKEEKKIFTSACKNGYSEYVKIKKMPINKSPSTEKNKHSLLK